MMVAQISNEWTAIVRRIFLAGVCVLTATARAAVAQDFSHPEQAAPSAAVVEQANDALASGDLQGALKILTNLNAQMPHNAQILYNLGVTLEALGSGAAASNDPQAAAPKGIQAGPPNGAPAGRPTAESCYRAAIAADPSFAPPHAALGLLLARTGRAEEARTELLAVTRLPGVDPVLQGRTYRALARLELGSSALDDRFGSAPASGDPSATADRLADASSDLLAALKLTPEQPNDILLAAEIARASKDLAGAEQAYRRYLALAGDAADPDAIAALGSVLLAEGHFSEAGALLAPALAHDPGHPAFTALLAQAWMNSGDPAKIAQAAPLVESLHAKDPANTAVTRMLGRIYLETGQPERADPLFAALIAAQPNHPDATLLDDRGETLIRLHRPGEAEKLLRQAVADRNGFPTPAAFGDAATHLAFAAEEIDDPATTLQALALRATVLPPSASSLFLAATANDDLHHSTQAADLYKQFLAAAHGTLPDQESQARRRLAELEHRK
ncbi:MAG TPA: tetratricopeptide repeat protein [Acidobacteriaceae bacterium]|nr:tetratricopeptide repeat protein [Acidobacteriaceae bacterium]